MNEPCPDCGGACAWHETSPDRWEGTCFGECGGYPIIDQGEKK